MANKTFVDNNTVIDAEWLNDVNDTAYEALGDGTNTPKTAGEVKANLNLEIGTDIQAYDAGLESISGLTTAADKMIYTTGVDTYVTTDLTAFARSLLDDADAGTARTTLDAQQADATLTALAGTLTTANKIPYATAPNTAGELDFLDEDSMTSDSNTAVPSQQSVKAYVDNKAAMPAGHINGLLWSNDSTDATNDFQVSAGECRSSDDTTDITLGSSQIKQMDAAWATGSNAGALATGATAWADGISYHVFVGLIAGVVEVIVDSDPDAANAIANNGLGAHRRIYSFKGTIGPSLRAVNTVRQGRRVEAIYDVMVFDKNGPVSTTAELLTLSVPTGVATKAKIGTFLGHTSTMEVLITETQQVDSVPSTSLRTLSVANSRNTGEMERSTDTSGQIRIRSSVSGGLMNVWTIGYTVEN